MNTALIISHPGHELRVHHWLETAKPLVLVLTDGSVSTHQSRLPSTTGILNRAGAHAGPIYGRFTDVEIYSELLQQNLPLFQGMMDQMVALLVDHEIDLVAGDAIEGYNPSHDLCRYLIGGAVESASRRHSKPIRNYDFPLIGRPDACPDSLTSQAIWVDLDEPALERKLAAAKGYPELAAEVETALQALGKSAFQRECLRPVANDAGLAELPEQPPYYERHGEKRLKEGIYQHIIRYREHLQPMAEALWQHAVKP